MAHRNQTALLFVRILSLCHILTGFPGDPRVMLVPRGEPVRMICNISTKNETLITWSKGRSVFQYFLEKNVTLSNFSVQRLEINHELPSKLIIFSAQPEDEGLYTCNITDRIGLNTITWNLTVSENLNETNYFLYILLTGLLLCGIMFALFLCRLYSAWTKTPNKDLYDNRTWSCVQYHVQLGGMSIGGPSTSFAVSMTGSTNEGSVQSVASSGLIRRQFR